MTAPAWLPATFAAIMIAVAVVSAARLAITASGGQILSRDADLAHLLMAIAMAGMLTAGLRTLPAGAWEPVFGLLAAWFAWRVIRESRGSGPRAWASSCHAPHLAHSLAMLYMFVALGPPAASASAMSAAGALRVPTLALVLALLLVGYTVRDLDRLPSPVAARLPQAALATTGAPAAPPDEPQRSRTSVPTPFIPYGTGRPTSTTQLSPRPLPPSKENLDAQPRQGRSGDSARAAVATPWVATCCRIAMGVTMAYMLVIMI